MASEKEQLWLDAYLRTFNATEAARIAGYKWPNVQGQQKKDKFREEITTILRQRAMSPDEIIDELQQIAQADLGDFMDVHAMGFNLTLQEAKEKGYTKFIKKIKQRTTISLGKGESDDREQHDLEIELYSRHEALRDLGKIHALFTDKTRAEDWRTDLIAMLRKGELTPETVLRSIDPATAHDLFREAGVKVLEPANA